MTGRPPLPRHTETAPPRREDVCRLCRGIGEIIIAKRVKLRATEYDIGPCPLCGGLGKTVSEVH